MAKKLEELEKLRELLQIEKEEDLEQYKKKVASQPLHKRQENGVAWYPLNIVKQGYTMGERAFVIVERTNHLEDEHQFRSGKTVRLFSNQVGEEKSERNGVVYYVNKNKMKIILNTKDLPDWVGKGLVGVDLLFDDRTYMEMDKALSQVIKAKGDRLAELRDIFMGEQASAYYPEKEPVSIPVLNDSQNKAVQNVLATRDVAIIHGPPGTGKTTTVVHAVKQLTQTEACVLVAAPSNTAADLLTERLATIGLNVVRIGNISRLDESILSHTMEMRMNDHPDSKNVKKIKVQAAEMRKKAKRYKRTFGREEAMERRNLFKEAGELMAWANQLEDRMVDQILDGAQVITCTLVGAADKVLSNRKFRTVIIDEAAQALEPATWIPILKASRVVLTGDPYQLPPTVKSMEAARKGLAVTLIEKSIHRVASVSLLTIQYRMNNAIMAFSNQQFYDNQLKAAEGVGEQRLPIANNHPVVYVDTAGCGFDEKVHESNRSRYNPEEFQILCEHLYQLLDAMKAAEEPLPTIALISPYREQVQYMTDIVAEDPRLMEAPITVNTVDGFQGQERDVVYISLVRANAKGEIGFLKDYRRMNVAMTRARKQLIVVGDSATIGNDKFYTDFLTFCETEGQYETAWAFMQ